MDIATRDTFVALLEFAAGGDAGLLVVAPAPTVAQQRWCRWTSNSRFGVGSPDDLERLSLAMMRVGYALGIADSWTGRQRDGVARSWMERTLPRMLEPAGIVVTAVVPLGGMTEVEIAGDRLALWERCRNARADGEALHHEALLQLEEALNEMGGVVVHGFDDDADPDGEAGDALPTGEILGTAQEGASHHRGNVA